MGKLYFRAACAVLTALLAWGGTDGAYADTGTATVKMTYVDGSNTTTSYGEVTTATVGYLKISNGELALANAKWGVNNIVYLQVDASAIEGTITNATLSATLTNKTASSSKNGRNAVVGVGYNSSTWSSSLTWGTADRSITTVGSTTTVTAPKKGKTTEADASFDITEAFTNSENKVVTLLVYATNAGGCDIADPTVTVEYTTATVYSATFTFTETNDSTPPTVKIYSDEAKTTEVAANALVNGTYYYTATLEGYEDATGSFTVSGADTTVSITMTKKPTFTFTVNAVDGDNNAIQALFTDTAAYDGKKETYYVPAYLTDDNGKVTHKKADKTYNYSTTATVTAQTVSYTAYTGTAYFVEAEDKIKGANVTSGNYSNGTAVRSFTSAKDLLTVGETGVYKLTYAIANNNTRQTAKVVFFKNDSQIGDTIRATASVNYVKTTGTGSIDSITIATGDVVKAEGTSSNLILDYVLVEKIGDAAAPTLTIGSANLASYSNASAVTVPEDVVIYKAAAPSTDGVVTLTKVDGQVIPAGTGVFLYSATTGEKTLSYGGTSTADFSGNALKGTGNGTYTVADGETVYAIVADKQAVAKVNAGVEIPANKAYLPVTTDAAKQLRIVFDSETTGINEVKGAGESVNNQNAYNLAGQRVGKAYKGVTVKNGRKYIAK